MADTKKKHEPEIAYIRRSKEASSFALRESFQRFQRALEVLDGNILKASKLIDPTYLE